ncbi:MAG: hypothetical protein LBQ00_09650 [Syntrophobacterales bacterium]|jgi:hypothetical protein|nr:hypothetical protein [Syntrophobacterales bacterium]
MGRILIPLGEHLADELYGSQYERELIRKGIVGVPTRLTQLIAKDAEF